MEEGGVEHTGIIACLDSNPIVTWDSHIPAIHVGFSEGRQAAWRVFQVVFLVRWLADSRARGDGCGPSLRFNTSCGSGPV